MRNMRINVAEFVSEYNDAVAAGISVSEFCQLTGLRLSTLHGRIEQLARRGVVLPMLAGMRRHSRLAKRVAGLAHKRPGPVVEAVRVESIPSAMPPGPMTFTVCVGCGL